MKVAIVDMNWNTDLPVFAKASFLRAVGSEFGWLGGFSDSGHLRCILPYTILQKAIFRLARFRVETIPLVEGFGIEEEKVFLEGTLEFLKAERIDVVIPATTNTIFRTFPEGADAAPYGTYVIDLHQPEEVLFKNIDRIVRQNIKTAQRLGIIIRDAEESEIDAGYRMIRDTFKRSELPFMKYDEFRRFLSGLEENGKSLVADCQGAIESFVVFAFSRYGAFAIYAGNAPDQHQGANKLLYWEAIRTFKGLGCRTYDFVGARVDPEKGSKQEALALFKKRFGATLKRGFMWKYAINPVKFRLYNIAARLRSGGDIVDAERHKLNEKRKND